MLFIETSAKTAANVSMVFETLAKKLAGYSEPVPALPESAPIAAPQLPASTKAVASPPAKHPTAPRSRVAPEQQPQDDAGSQQMPEREEVTPGSADSKAPTTTKADKGTPASDMGRQSEDGEQ